MTNKEQIVSTEGFQAYLVPISSALNQKPPMIDIIIASAVARWRVVAIWAAAGFALAVGLGFLITPIYRATVVVLPRAADSSQGIGQNGLLSKLGALGGLSGLLSSIGSSQAESVAVLESRDLAESFISDQQIVGKLTDSHGWLEDLVGLGSEPSDELTASEAYRRFSEHVLGISEDHQTGLVTITIDWNERAVARDWANEFVMHANSAIKKQAIDLAQATLRYVAVQAEHANEVAVRSTLDELAENQLKTLALAQTRPDFAFKVIDSAKLPDRHDKVRPHKVTMGFVGMLLGGMIAVVGVYLRRPR